MKRKPDSAARSARSRTPAERAVQPASTGSLSPVVVLELDPGEDEFEVEAVVTVGVDSTCWPAARAARVPDFARLVTRGRRRLLGGRVGEAGKPDAGDYARGDTGSRRGSADQAGGENLRAGAGARELRQHPAGACAGAFQPPVAHLACGIRARRAPAPGEQPVANSAEAGRDCGVLRRGYAQCSPAGRSRPRGGGRGAPAPATAAFGSAAIRRRARSRSRHDARRVT